VRLAQKARDLAAIFERDRAKPERGRDAGEEGADSNGRQIPDLDLYRRAARGVATEAGSFAVKQCIESNRSLGAS